MRPQSLTDAIGTEDLFLALDRSTADEKIGIHDLFATAGQVACALTACGLLHALFQ
jgi:hypothetical protein